MPERLEKNESGVPLLKVYDVKNEKLETLSVEDYLPAVLAGEMAGDWPLEALKAQAILARTFVLQLDVYKRQAENVVFGRDAVAHLIVDGRADALGKSFVIQRRGNAAHRGRLLIHPAVDFRRGNARADVRDVYKRQGISYIFPMRTILW